MHNDIWLYSFADDRLVQLAIFLSHSSRSNNIGFESHGEGTNLFKQTQEEDENSLNDKLQRRRQERYKHGRSDNHREKWMGWRQKITRNRFIRASCGFHLDKHETFSSRKTAWAYRRKVEQTIYTEMKRKLLVALEMKQHKKS